MSTADLRARLERSIDQLPTLPAVVAKLMGLKAGSDTYFDDVREVIESAPAFAARIIAVSNSAASAPLSPITGVAAAIARIGSKPAANLILASAVTQVFIPRDDWEKSLWRHAIQVAIGCRGLAQFAGTHAVDADTAYLMGLLHDVGRFVMFQQSPDKLREVDESQMTSAVDLINAERRVLGITHGELGAKACVAWGLPEVVGKLVREHHEPVSKNPSSATERLLAILRLADAAMFPSALPGTPSLAELDEDELARRLTPLLPDFLNLTPRKLFLLVERTTRDADAACEALQIV